MNNRNNHPKLIMPIILAVAIFAGLYATTSLQLSYASLLQAEDSECIIFCPRIEDSMNYDYNFNQHNECGNSQVNPYGGGGIVLPEQFGNGTESTKNTECNNSATIPSGGR